MLSNSPAPEIFIHPTASVAAAERVLTPEAIRFLAELHGRFESARRRLLERRRQREEAYAQGEIPTWPRATEKIRRGAWSVPPAPADLEDRRVEITGPTDRKMVINALNSGARVFMADCEDSQAPSWSNVLEGHVNLCDAVRRQLSFRSAAGKEYRLHEELATLVVRPRGWHLVEEHFRVDGAPMSAALFDFGLYFFHNAAELLRRGSGPYFYLAKLEGYREAALWNEVFLFAQASLGLAAGSIRATVLIETLPAAFEMEEILHALGPHAAGLNAGRWDYIFSAIKTFRGREMVFPDRAQITMEAPFMKAYAQLLVQVCHRRGAHAIGGMAAFIPSRKDPEVNRRALAQVRRDKQREAAAGYDGTWVAHPDLVPVAEQVFGEVLGDRPHQKSCCRPEMWVWKEDLLDFRIDGGVITEAGVRNNIRVALQYVDAWLEGIGAVAIDNLMEDAATAEISRAQLWQWLRWGARLEDGRVLTRGLYRRLHTEELEGLLTADRGSLRTAAELLDRWVLAPRLSDFFTLDAYPELNRVADQARLPQAV